MTKDQASLLTIIGNFNDMLLAFCNFSPDSLEFYRKLRSCSRRNSCRMVITIPRSSIGNHWNVYLGRCLYSTLDSSEYIRRFGIRRLLASVWCPRSLGSVTKINFQCYSMIEKNFSTLEGVVPIYLSEIAPPGCLAIFTGLTYQLGEPD